jgi:hypothetical protein
MHDSIGSMFKGVRRRRAGPLLSLAMAAFLCALASPAHAGAPPGTFVTFDVPGGARDTLVTGINPAGAITGWTFDGTVFLGFVRAPNGTVTTIAPPGSTATFVGSQFGGYAGPPINPAGAITGSYADVSGLMHGFVRAPDGKFTTFDAPGAVNGTILVCCITPAGAVAGIYNDASSVSHGFVRAPNGTFATFDPPGSTGTTPGGINPAGALTGNYSDANGQHGFLRADNGTISTFDAPGAVFGTQPGGLDPAGATTGFYNDASFVSHGFLRTPDGTFTTFDPPGSTAPFGTFPVVGINPSGAIIGTYQDANFNFHGFLRGRDGSFTIVDPPGSASTGPGGINPAEVIAGNYFDATTGAAHGFLFFPH